MNRQPNKCAFFRVDANRKIGSGHLVRCRLIADKLMQKGVKPFFIYNEIPERYKIELAEKGFGTVQIDNTENETGVLTGIIKNSGCEKSILITDSDKELFYKKEFQLAVRSKNTALMTITFYNKTHFYSDIILNQNIMAPHLKYSTEPYTEKLLGTEYVILDPRFTEIKNKNISWEKKENIVLVSFGGADKADRTVLVYDILQNFSEFIDKIIVVVGALYENKETLEKLISGSKINTELFINTDKMPFLMSEAKYAITSGGLTAWELGVAKTLNIIISESERENLSGKYLGDHGYCYFLGNVNGISSDKIKVMLNEILSNPGKNKAMVEKLYAEINPKGVDKVAEIILQKLG